MLSTLLFYKNKSLDCGKKIKNKLRTKPGLQFTEYKNKVSSLAILKIRTKHQSRGWLDLYCTAFLNDF